jgi:hypothetical protein
VQHPCEYMHVRYVQSTPLCVLQDPHTTALVADRFHGRGSTASSFALCFLFLCVNALVLACFFCVRISKQATLLSFTWQFTQIPASQDFECLHTRSITRIHTQTHKPSQTHTHAHAHTHMLACFACCFSLCSRGFEMNHVTYQPLALHNQVYRMTYLLPLVPRPGRTKWLIISLTWSQRTGATGVK